MGTIMCSDVVFDYIFHQNTNRFLQVSTMSYYGGQDNNDDILFVAGGTRTKIEWLRR
jgi:hypothetical protein